MTVKFERIPNKIHLKRLKFPEFFLIFATFVNFDISATLQVLNSDNSRFSMLHGHPEAPTL